LKQPFYQRLTGNYATLTVKKNVTALLSFLNRRSAKWIL
jgi:hypothetical protein